MRSASGQTTARRLSRWLGRVVVILLSLIALIAIAVVVLLALPVGRRWAAQTASSVVSDSLAGRVEITAPRELGLSHLGGFEVRVFEPQGRQVLRLSGGQLRWRPAALLRSVLAGEAPQLELTSVRARRVVVDLARASDDAEPTLLLARAFAPARPETDPQAPEAAPSVLLRVDEIAIEALRVEHALGPDENAPIQVNGLSGWVALADTMQGAARVERVQVPVPGVSDPFVAGVELELAALGAQAGPLALAEVSGELAGASAELKLALEGTRWTAEGSVGLPRESGSRLALPVRLRDGLAIDVLADGDAEQARASVEAQLGDDRLELGVAAALDGSNVALQASSPGLDPSAFNPEWPAASVPLTLDAELATVGELRLNATLQTGRFEFRDQTVPPLRVTAQADAQRWFAELDASTPQSRLRVEAEVERQRADRLQLAAQLRLERPSSFWRRWLSAFGVNELGGLEMELDGAYRAAARQLELNTEFALRRLALGPSSLRLQQANGGGAVSLRSGRLTGDVRASGHGLKVDQVEVETWSASVEGSLPRVLVQLEAEGAVGGEPALVMVRGHTESFDPPELSDVRFYVHRAQRAVLADVERVQLGPRIAVRGLRLEGPGQLLADVTWSSRRQRVDVRAYELELQQLSAMFEPWLPPLNGTLNVEAKLDSSEPLRGSVAANVRELSVADVRLDRAALELTARGGTASGQAWVRLEQGGWASLDVSDLQLKELETLGLQQLPSAGSAIARFDLDLARVSRQIPALIDSWILEGRLSGQLKSRFGERGGLSVDVALIGPKAMPLEPAASQPAREASLVEAQSSGVDLSSMTWLLDADYQLGGGDLSGRLVVEQAGRTGPLATATVDTTIALSSLLDAELERLRDIPLRAAVEINETAFAELPAGVVPAGFDARVEAKAEVEGTWREPEAKLQATLYDWSATSQQRSYPVTLQLDAEYGAGQATGELVVRHEQRQVGRTRVEVAAPSPLALTRPSRFEVETELDAVPLGCFPFLRDYGVTGRISAQATLLGGAEAEATVARQMRLEFSGSDVTVLDVRFDNLEGRLQFDEERLAAYLDVDQPEGQLNATLRASTRGGAGLQQLRPERVSLSAEHFQVRPLLLLVNDQLSDLQGYLDGGLQVEFADSAIDGAGRLTFSDGSIQIPQLGERFSDVEVELNAAEGGVLQFDRIAARALTGRLEGEGWLEYDRLGVRRVDARLRIPSGDPFPVVYQGIRLGWVDGRLALVGERRDEQLQLMLRAPELEVQLEQTDFSVQSLEPSELVKVGAFNPAGRFVRLPGDARETEPTSSNGGPLFEVQLGEDVWIYRGQGTFASLGGSVALLPNGTLDGELALQQGQIDVMGRIFEVRFGTITFHNEDPPNPTVIAQAVWPSPSGHEIIAEFRGPVRSGTLELRAEPPLSYSQILNALLFGDPEGDLGSGEGGGSAAGAVASTVASAGLGRALSDLSNLDVQASVDVSDTAAPRPEVRVRLSPRVSVEVSYNPVSNPLAEVPDSALLSIDWRLSPRWSLETTFGDHGTSMFDAMWRFRY